MTRTTAFLLVLSLATGIFAMPAASADERGPTVAILVPAEGSPGLMSSGEQRIRWQRVEVPFDGGMERTLANARARFGNDAVLERFYELAVSPNDDDFYPKQWHLENTGQTGGTADADIDATTAWKVANGDGIVVAVIDSGVDASHPDLAGQVIQGYDYRDWDNDPSPEGTGPNEVHATFIAGIIAAADNDIGVVGVAPGAKILNMRACHQGSCSSFDLAYAIYDSVDAGVEVINLSLGILAAEDPPLEAAIDYAESNNVLVVAAAGNKTLDLDQEANGDLIIPAELANPNILAVTASDHQDQIAGFSNFGSSIDLFAPGSEIWSTAFGEFGPYASGSGTSFAAPIVAGVAALLLSHDPGIDFEELVARITAFTDRPSSLNGYGIDHRVNAGKALTNRFIDTSDTVFHDTIKWLAEQGITEGCNPPQNHMYCPGDNVTRGQMAVFFARTFGLPSTSADYFDDDDGRFYESSANRMAEAGITVGCEPNRYCGERDISRAEMAAMLSRVLGLPASSTDHFGDDDGSTFESAIDRIADAGITKGCNPPANDRYCPDDDVNRGQMAAFLQRSSDLSD